MTGRKAGPLGPTWPRPPAASPTNPRAAASPHPGMDELVDLLLDSPREVLKGGVGHVLEGTGLGPEQGPVPVHLDEGCEIVGLGLLGDRGGREHDLGVVVECVLRAHDLQAEARPSGPIPTLHFPRGPRRSRANTRTDRHGLQRPGLPPPPPGLQGLSYDHHGESLHQAEALPRDVDAAAATRDRGGQCLSGPGVASQLPHPNSGHAVGWLGEGRARSPDPSLL